MFVAFNIVYFDFPDQTLFLPISGTVCLGCPLFLCLPIKLPFN